MKTFKGPSVYFENINNRFRKVNPKIKNIYQIWQKY